MIYDVEDDFFEFFGSDARRKRPANPEMRGSPFTLGDERIGRLLDPVVKELIGVTQAEDETAPNRFPQSLVDLLLGFAVHQGHGGDLSDIAQTSELSQRFPRHIGQLAQLRGHQIGHVVGEAFGVDGGRSQVQAAAPWSNTSSASSAKAMKN